MPAAEVLDRVNENDQPVGTIARGDVFRLHANFRVAHVFIFDGIGELLLQQLASSRSRHPGRWGSSLAAYVAAGETYAAAATRRLSEELGVSNVGLREIGKTSMFDEGSLKFITLYEAGLSGPFVIDPSHISEIAFFPLDQVRSWSVQDPAAFTPTFLHLLDFYVRTRRL